MKQYLITPCVQSGNNWRCLHILTDSVYTFNWGGWVLETPNRVPGAHDKVPVMKGGDMSLLKIDETL